MQMVVHTKEPDPGVDHHNPLSSPSLITSNPSEGLNLRNLTRLTVNVIIPRRIWFGNTAQREAT
ncbi:hypothetical protein EYF80_022772 [Liparis tanakae]|uniref:Uncharacterized protein n=1 Tax=Liparis tanakae TaxID=230148 RepID=A0A4Z2HM90_9TELE|nr:hypothetical protein EYF80_022772 [Liparis tanakae]